MKYAIQINQAVIFENEWHKSSDLNTWALFDFLCFFNNADGHRTLNDGEFKWINYKYIIESLPLCDFYNQKIKKHLDILASFGIIALAKDDGNNIYFKLLPNHRILFEKNYQPPRENFTNPLVKNYQPPRENFTHNNNKESISKNNNNDSNPPTPQRESEGAKSHTSKASEYTEEFEKFWSEYPRKINKKLAFKAWNTCLKAKVNADLLISKAREYAQIVKAKGTQEQYIKHAQSWLNGSCYENDYTALLSQQDKQRQAVMQRGLSDWGSNDDDGVF